MAKTFDDWRIYADATCAGLSALVPLPFVDMFIEAIFRHRMPATIASARQIEIDDYAATRLGRKKNDMLGVTGCLIVPKFIVKVVLRRIWRKILYVFTIKDAADQLNEYWHRAYLLDHLICAGHAASGADIERALLAFETSLDGADTSGVRSVARQVVVGAKHVPHLLRRARRRGADTATEEQRRLLDEHWDVISASLSQLERAYEHEYGGGAEMDREPTLV